LKPISTIWSSASRLSAAVAAQRHAAHILHHQVGLQRIVDRVVDLHHVRVLQLAHQGCLGGEEMVAVVVLHALAGGGQAHPLDGHVAVVEGVDREKNLAGGALAQARHHVVLADAVGHAGFVGIQQQVLGIGRREGQAK